MDLHPRPPGLVPLNRVDAHVTVAGGLLWLLGGLGFWIAVHAMARALNAAGLEAVGFAYGALAALAVAATSLLAGFGLQRGLPWAWRLSVVVYCAWAILVPPVAAYGLYALMRRRVRDELERSLELPAEATLSPAAPSSRRRPAARVMLMPAIAGLPGPAWQLRTTSDDAKPSPSPEVPRTRRGPAPRVHTDRRWPPVQRPRPRRPRADVMLLRAVDLA